MLRAADQVVFISATVRDRFADARFAALRGWCSMVLIPPCSPASPDARIALRVRYGLWLTSRSCCSSGASSQRRGLHVIAALARRTGPTCASVLVGRGPIDPCAWGPAKRYVIPQTALLDARGLYRAADLLLLPSVGEGFPLVVQEAIASGLRVLCGTDTAHADPNERVSGSTMPILTSRIPSARAERVATAIDRLPAGAPPAEMAAQAARCYSWPAWRPAVAAAIGDLTP